MTFLALGSSCSYAIFRINKLRRVTPEVGYYLVIACIELPCGQILHTICPYQGSIPYAVSPLMKNNK